MRKDLGFGLALLCYCSLSACTLGIMRVPESTHEICQLTGKGASTGPLTTGGFNRTDLSAKLTGTDLGASFSAPSGMVYFLFGDTEHADGISRDKAADSLAYAPADANPERCIALTFLNAPDGGYQPPHLFESPDKGAPSISLGIFEVPTSGFVANGSTYFTFVTDARGTPRRPTRSVLAKMRGLPGAASDHRSDFSRLYDLPADKLLNVSSVLVDDNWRPSQKPTRALFFGSGVYRASSTVYLATVPLAQLDTGRLSYLKSTAREHVEWSTQSGNATGLFTADVKCIGELSVTWNPYLAKWLMLYNCDGPQRGILYRTAENPWGPWSRSNVLFDPRNDKGYCYFIHDRDPSNCPRGAMNPKDNLISRDIGAESYGGEYGAYVIDAFTKGSTKTHSSTIYFTLSTWNPYQVVLMKSTLVGRRGG